MKRISSTREGVGRYECRSGGSSKFWECWPDPENPGTFATRWGKIGTKHSWQRCKRGLSEWEAVDKINEKRSKYELVHARYSSFQEAVADESAEDMKANTVQVEAVEAPAPARRF